MHNTLKIYVKSFFSKRDERQSKNRVCNVNSKFADDVLEKRVSLIWTYIGIYTYVRALSKTQSLNLALTMQANFVWKGTYRVLEKNSSDIHTCHLYSSICEDIFFKTQWVLLKKWTCNTNTKFIDCVLEKSFSHMNISIDLCRYTVYSLIRQKPQKQFIMGKYIYI